MAASRADDDLDFVKSGMGDELDTMLVYNVLRTAGHLGPRIDAVLRGQKLRAAQLNALLVIRSAGEDGLLMGEIGRRLIVTKSNVTGLVDRLERDGLVRRAKHTDRRAIAVKLTAEGAALVESVAPRHARALSDLALGLSASEKRTLVRLLTKMRRSLRKSRMEKSG